MPRAIPPHEQGAVDPPCAVKQKERKVRSCRARCGVCGHCGVVRRQRAACKTRWFLNRDTCRGCNNQRDEKHDECSQTAAWPQLGGGSCGDAAHHVNKPNERSCIGTAAADTGRSIGDARGMYPDLGKRGAAGGGSDEASSALGTEDGPSAGQISSCSRSWREGDASAAEGPRRISSKRSRR